MEKTESQIIASCQAGELKEFARLYDIYIKKIYDFIYYKTFHKETAEDLTSQTFFKALANIKKYSPQKGSFSSWLYQIARNTTIDYYRTKKNDANIDDFFNLASAENIQRNIETAQKLEEIKKYLAKLKPQQKEIIIMRLWDNLSYQEIADLTGLTIGACKMTFSRVISQLREETALIILYLLIITKKILWLIN